MNEKPASNGTGGRRQRLSFADRRDQLLLAALEEFGARGFHLTQMDHVAAAAGVSKALLYQHFPSKDELFAAVTGGIVDAYVAGLPAVLEAAGDALSGLREAVRVLVGMVQEMPQAWKLIARYLADPELGTELRVMRQSLYDALATLLVAYYEPATDKLPEDEVRHVAVQTVPLLVGAVQALLSWWLEHPEVPREEVEQRAVEFGWLGLDRIRRGERLAR